jgi:hypothetical protein
MEARGQGGRRLVARASVLFPALILASGLLIGLAAGPASATGGQGALAQAKKDLLVRTDFPAGWRGQGSVSTSSGSGGSSFPGENQLAACLGVRAAVINLNTPNATSPNFQNKAGTDYAQDNVSVFPSTKVAARQYTTIADPKVPGCLTTVFQGPAKQEVADEAGKNVTLGTITVAPANPASLVPHATGFTISFPVTTQGITVKSAVTIVSMVRGNTGSQLTLTSVGLPFPSALARHLASVAYTRT